MPKKSDEYLLAGAEISACGLYRHRLWRVWDEVSYACLFVMLNPSTADAAQDDPTIRKCVQFAKNLGHGALEVVNLFDYRATDPKVLYSEFGGPYLVSQDWNHHFRAAVDNSEVTVVAWGAHGKLYNRDDDVMRFLRELGVRPQCLDVNKDGTPCHPLYQPYSKALKPYAGRIVP